MNRIPGGREVELALKNAMQEVRSAIKQINEYAGRLLAKGDYSGAEQLIPKAREVEGFQEQVEALLKSWRLIQREAKGKSKTKEKPIPLWKYYAPTLRAIIELEGSGKQEAIEEKIEPMIQELYAANNRTSDVGFLKKKMKLLNVLRSMKKEGFVQRVKKEWLVTNSGRKAAEAAIKDGKSQE